MTNPPKRRGVSVVLLTATFLLVAACDKPAPPAPVVTVKAGFGEGHIRRLEPLWKLLDRRWPKEKLPTPRELADLMHAKFGVGPVEPLAGGYDAFVKAYAALDPDWALGMGFDDPGIASKHDDESIRARLLLNLRAFEGAEPLLQDMLAPVFRDWLNEDYYEFSTRLPISTVAAWVAAKVHGRAGPPEKRFAAIPGLVALSKRSLKSPPREIMLGAIEDVNRTRDVVTDEAARAALEDYADFLDRVVKPRASQKVGCGYDNYAFHLRAQLGREVAPEDVARDALRDFEAAMREMDRLHADGEDLARIDAGRPDLDKRFDVFRTEIERARRLSRDLVAPPAGETLDLIETPEIFEGWITSAGYQSPGPLAGSKHGLFMLTPVDAAETIFNIRHTVWHESYPGHHVQELLSNEAPTMLQRCWGSSFAVEGWAAYVEDLVHEQGLCYGGRDDQLVALWDRALRAEGAAIDVLFNISGLRYDDAIALMNEIRQAENDLDAERAIAGVTGPPTYEAAYFVGAREIRNIREACRRRLGARFSLREFHERLLRCGAIPPATAGEILEREWR